MSVILEEQLQAKGYKIQIINGSVSGSTSAGGLNRIAWTLQEPDIDLLIIGLGANDMLRGINPKETKSNLEKIIQQTQKKNIPIILAGMVATRFCGCFNWLGIARCIYSGICFCNINVHLFK